MTGLHRVLALAAALPALAAGLVDRDGPAPRRASASERFIAAPDLARLIMTDAFSVHVFDLRPRTAFEQYHVPGATPGTPETLSSTPLPARGVVVLYGDDAHTIDEAIRVLTGRGHSDVLVLREGVYEWVARVLEPRLAVDAAPGERAAFEAAAPMSRFFGGVPRTGVPRAEVPQGYWTGHPQRRDRLAEAALEAATAVRRRGC